MPLARDLPPVVIEALREHYREGAQRAENGYDDSEEEEDSITGDLGRAIRGSITVTAEDTEYKIRTRYRKFRSKGEGALERLTGADGIFEIQAYDEEGNLLGSKSLLFQAKKNWRARHADLGKQIGADYLTGFPRATIVVNYTPNGYFAVPAEDVLAAEADWRRISPGAKRRLSDVLADSFVSCDVGREDFHYDWDKKQLELPEAAGPIFRRVEARNRIRTTVKKRRPKSGNQQD